MLALPDDVRSLIDGPNYAHLATVQPDGAPHSVPLWVGMVGDRIAFLTGPTSRKARNIAHDPRVSLSLTDHANPFTMAHVRGRVVESLQGPAAWQVIDRLAMQYLGAPYPRGEERVVYLVEPDRGYAISYG